MQRLIFCSSSNTACIIKRKKKKMMILSHQINALLYCEFVQRLSIAVCWYVVIAFGQLSFPVCLRCTWCMHIGYEILNPLYKWRAHAHTRCFDSSWVYSNLSTRKTPDHAGSIYCHKGDKPSRKHATLYQQLIDAALILIRSSRVDRHLGCKTG